MLSRENLAIPKDLMGSGKKVFSPKQVSVHNKITDCWVIINARVYEVTNFLNDHPGGDEVLMAAAGKDASEEFEEAGHGSAARLMLDEFYVGEIDQTSTTTPKMISQLELPPCKEASTIKPSVMISDIRLLGFLLPLAILGIAFCIGFYNN